MKTFGISSTQKKTWKYYIRYVNGTFVTIIILCFIFFVFFAKINDMMFSKDKFDIFKEDLGQIAFSTRTFDKELSHFFLTLDSIIQSYIQEENIFITKAKEIDECRTYLEQNKEYLKRI